MKGRAESRERANHASEAPSRLPNTVGGHAILVIAAAPAAIALSKRLLDGAVRRQDSFGHYAWYSTGHQTQFLVYGVAALLTLLALQSLVKNLRSPTGHQPSGEWFTVGLLGLFAFSAFVQEAPVETVAYALIIGGSVMAAILHPPNARSMRRLAILGVVVTLTAFVYIFTHYDIAATPCREDGKCGVTGEIWISFFPQENFFAIYVATLLPTTIFLRSPRTRFLAAGIMTFAVATTGSRAALISVALSLVLLFHALRKGAVAFRLPKWAAWLPVVALAASTVAFLTAQGLELTGRGVIYEAVRTQLRGADLFLGPGIASLQEGYFQTQILPFLPTHEHGQAPYILSRSGLVGFALICTFLAALAIRSDRAGDKAVALVMLIAASPFFVTETLFQLSLDDPSVWLLVAGTGLYARNKQLSQVGH